MENIREVVIKKAKEEAENIINLAKLEAEKIIAEAKKKKEEAIAKEKEKIIKEINAEARIAEARMRVRQKLSEAKNEAIDIVKFMVKEILDSMNIIKRTRSLEKLAVEAVDELLSNLNSRPSKIVVYVSRNDKEVLENILPFLKQRYGDLLIEIREAGISGGIIVEEPEKGITIDNSYDSRIKKIISLYAKEFQRIFE